MDDLSTVRSVASRLLARREHTRAELRRKLCQRGHAPGLVEDVLEALVRERLLSDERFVEAYTHARAQKGYGPARIAGELRERDVSDDLIARHVDFTDAAWQDAIRRVAHKRFGTMPPQDYEERVQRSRFLQYRGFTTDQIKQFLNADSDE